MTQTFPFSRHSSYQELRHLVRSFRPSDVYPCVVDEKTWTESKSIRNLFGDLCSGSQFSHDEAMELKMRDPRSKVGTKRSHGEMAAPPDSPSAYSQELSSLRRRAPPPGTSTVRAQSATVEPGERAGSSHRPTSSTASGSSATRDSNGSTDSASRPLDTSEHDRQVQAIIHSFEGRTDAQSSKRTADSAPAKKKASTGKPLPLRCASPDCDFLPESKQALRQHAIDSHDVPWKCATSDWLFSECATCFTVYQPHQLRMHEISCRRDFYDLYERVPQLSADDGCTTYVRIPIKVPKYVGGEVCDLATELRCTLVASECLLESCFDGVHGLRSPAQRLLFHRFFDIIALKVHKTFTKRKLAESRVPGYWVEDIRGHLPFASFESCVKGYQATKPLHGSDKVGFELILKQESARIRYLWETCLAQHSPEACFWNLPAARSDAASPENSRRASEASCQLSSSSRSSDNTLEAPGSHSPTANGPANAQRSSRHKRRKEAYAAAQQGDGTVWAAGQFLASLADSVSDEEEL